MTSTSSLSTEWVYDPTHSVCYQASTQMFAIPSRSGQWEYVPITDFRPGESSTSHLTHKDKEEGEVEDDVGWGGLMEPEELQRVTSKAKHPAYTDPDKYAYGSIEVIPPSETPKHILRLVVSASPVLPIGGMAMIDAREGGIHIGRDRQIGQARLRIKEMEVSKTHAVVYWGRGCERIEDAEAEAEDEGWWIVDLGSTRGTQVNDTRLSEPKQSSLPHRLIHLSTIAIGQTILVAHVHPSWPCDECQLKADTEIRLDDGSTPDTETANTPQAYAMDSKDRRDIREMKRKREMAALKETLLSSDNSPKPSEAREYQDRAAMRRRLHPPSPPNQATTLETPPRINIPTALPAAPVNTFAATMLAKQGWSQGQGLGKTGTGRSEAIEVEMRTVKRGLGASGSKAVVQNGGDWKAEGKQRRYDELRER